MGDRCLMSPKAAVTRYREEQDEFLSRIITCDETWVHRYTPECKWSLMQWKHVSSPNPKKYKMQARFWLVFSGTRREDFLPQGHTVHADFCCTLFSDRLKPAIHRRRPGLLQKGVVLQHDNAPPHKAHQTIEKLEEMCWELL